MPAFEIYDSKGPRCIHGDFKRVILGRTGDIAIDDRVASRQHCEITASEVGYVLRDLESSNGTTLNLEPLERPVSLRDGDEIGIGKASVRFRATLDNAEPSLPRVPLTQGEGKTGGPSANAKVRRPHTKPAQPPRTRRPRPKTKPPPIQEDQLTQTEPEPPIQLYVAPQPDAGPPADPPKVGQIGQPVESESLTIDHIVPLNHEGKPAQAVDPKTGRISEAMLRLKELLLRSFQFHATDIHIEPRESNFIVRYRIDGYLHALGTLETRLTRAVYSIVKLLCNLDIHKRHIMHDGSFDIRLPDRRVQLRVSIAPSITGDKMVLRVLDTNLAPGGLDSLGLDSYVLEQVRQKSAQNSSMMVVCGPTGSGKTTTIYAIINEMHAHDRNIVTVEQPVEYKLDGVSQIEISPDHARGDTITFSDALRSLLRQDPDVILVGEIRDADTARTAVQAAMTGHLLLTTVHSRDSIGCIFRLLDLGVEPFLLASSLTAVLSQRLMRKLCPACKSKCRPAISALSRVGLDDMAGKDFFAAVGCDKCLGLGYRGRAPIFELLSVNDQVRDAIANRPTIQQLRVAAGDWIFQTLREDGVRKLRSGLTTVEEFSRVAHQDA